MSWTLELPGEKLERYRDTRGPGLGGMRLLLGALEERQDAKAARDRALLRLAFDLGLRRGELASLDLEHLDLEAGTLAVLGKGQEGRELLTLPLETTAVLHTWLEQRGLEPGPLFINFDRAQKGRRLTSASIYRMVRDLGDQVRLGPAARAAPYGDQGGARPLPGRRACGRSLQPSRRHPDAHGLRRQPAGSGRQDGSPGRRCHLNPSRVLSMN